MNIQAKFSPLFNIETGEGKLVFLLLAHSFFIGSARIFSRTSAYTLFLSEFDATALPFIYIGIGLIVTVLSFSYLKLSQRLSLSKLLSASVVFLIFSIIFFRAGLMFSSSKWLVFSLPIWYEGLWTLTSLEFWNLAGRLFNVRQGKRLFGLIGAGEQIAVILGGLMVPIVVPLTGTPNLLVLALISMIAIFILLLITTSKYQNRIVTEEKQSKNKQKGSVLSLIKNRYILAIFSFFALDIMVYFSVDNIFYAQAEVQMASEDQLAGFIGAFFALCSLLILFSRTFLTGRLISQYGIKISLLVSPLFLILTGLLAATTGTIFGEIFAFFVCVAFMRMLVSVFIESIELPSINVLYQPLPAVQRIQAQALVEGVVYSLSIGLTGVTLWLIEKFFQPTTVQLVYFVLSALLIYTSLAILLGRMYPVALLRALTKRRLDSTQFTFDDPLSIQILQRELESSNTSSVLYALNMLESVNPEALKDSWQRLLNHPEPEVRLDVLQRIQRLRLASLAGEIQRLIPTETSKAVLGAALYTLAGLSSDGAFETVSPFLNDPDLKVRRGAILGLLGGEAEEGIFLAEKKLLLMAASREPSERVFAAQMLGEAGTPGYSKYLLPLLQDETIQVQRAALRSAGLLKDPDLWPDVIKALKIQPLQRVAASALVNGGENVLPWLFKAFDGGGSHQPALVDICGRIGGQKVIDWLSGKIDNPIGSIRSQILHALMICRYQAQGEGADAVHRQIKFETNLAAWFLAILCDLDPAEGFELLRNSLDHNLAQILDRIFALLSFLYDAHTIIEARDNLTFRTADRKAYALEVLDITLSKEIKKELFPLLADLPLSQKLGQLGESFPQAGYTSEQRLVEIISSADENLSAWNKACTLYTAGLLAIQSLYPMVRVVLVEPEPLVQEMAVWALTRLGEPDDSTAINILKDSQKPEMIQTQGDTMLSTVEKVIALKKASVFAAIPDETLVGVAALLEEVYLFSGDTIFEKGELGDCMYIIYSGKVRVHDGEATLNTLEEGDVFGEIAVLDSEPRSASITAVTDTRLLQLAQEPLFALLDEQPDVARRIIRVLCHYLRNRMYDLNQSSRSVDSAVA